MRCLGCGECVESFHRHCPQCGMALAQLARARRSATQEGIPVAHMVPAPYGPPVAPDMPPPTRLSPVGERPHTPQQHTRVTTPAPATPTEHVRSRRLALMLGACLFLALMVWKLGGLPLTPLSALTAPTVATTTPACPSPPVDATAAHAITAPQLASALHDASHSDYRPANQTSRFGSGQPAYLTFKIATSASGTADVLFCLPGSHITGTLAIPSGSANRYAQFSATFTSSEVGAGEAILRWNGRVAAVLPFTVTRPAPSPGP